MYNVPKWWDALGEQIVSKSCNIFSVSDYFGALCIKGLKFVSRVLITILTLFTPIFHFCTFWERQKYNTLSSISEKDITIAFAFKGVSFYLLKLDIEEDPPNFFVRTKANYHKCFTWNMIKVIRAWRHSSTFKVLTLKFFKKLRKDSLYLTGFSSLKQN